MSIIDLALLAALVMLEAVPTVMVVVLAYKLNQYEQDREPRRERFRHRRRS